MADQDIERAADAVDPRTVTVRGKAFGTLGYAGGQPPPPPQDDNEEDD